MNFYSPTEIHQLTITAIIMIILSVGYFFILSKDYLEYRKLFDSLHKNAYKDGNSYRAATRKAFLISTLVLAFSIIFLIVKIINSGATHISDSTINSTYLILVAIGYFSVLFREYIVQLTAAIKANSTDELHNGDSIFWKRMQRFHLPILALLMMMIILTAMK